MWGLNIELSLKKHATIILIRNISTLISKVFGKSQNFDS